MTVTLRSSLVAVILFAAGCTADGLEPPETHSPDAGMTTPDTGVSEPPDAGPPCMAKVNGRTFSGDVLPLLQGRCSLEQCHGRDVTPLYAGTASQVRMRMVNVPGTGCGDNRRIVHPGHSEASYLINKLTGRDMCTGQRMPLLLQPLSRADIDKISDWICDGALDN